MPVGELKPNSVVVAILRPDRKHSGPNTSEDYLWIRCPGRTTAPKLHEQVSDSASLSSPLSDTDLDISQECKLRVSMQEAFDLKHEGELLSLATPMGSIANPDDRLVVLEMVGKSDFSSRLPPERQPLKPTK